ncbi:MAG: hypothetical protein WC612_02845 [Bdellovibrionales bacterium]|jgi:hypothetical protein
MFFPPDLAPNFMAALKPIWEADYPDHIKLRGLWSMLSGLQGAVLGQHLLHRIGNKVFAGPFRGMELSAAMMKNHLPPLLLGTYEWELHDAVEAVIAKPYKNIVNIGCSQGYYSVGFAMRMPQATVYAYDKDDAAQADCKALAALNNVEDRVIVGGAFADEAFSQFAGEETLVFMDIDGAEQDLLDPERFPALKKMDVIVELHDGLQADLSTVIPLRFAPTHDVRVIPNAAFSFPLDKILGPDYVPDHFDNLLATWEGRVGPTPYGVFARK